MWNIVLYKTASHFDYREQPFGQPGLANVTVTRYNNLSVK